MSFRVQKQTEDEWCWAAVSASVDHYFSSTSTVTQCWVAQRVLPAQVPPLDCCANPATCNTGAALEDALSTVERFNQIIEGSVTFEDVYQQLNAKLPVGARIRWYQGGAHFVVITACSVSPSGKQVLTISDPLFPDSTVYYNDFLSAYQAKTNGGGEWTHTYYLQP
jgi:hypothetical protein